MTDVCVVSWYGSFFRLTDRLTSLSCLYGLPQPGHDRGDKLSLTFCFISLSVPRHPGLFHLFIPFIRVPLWLCPSLSPFLRLPSSLPCSGVSADRPGRDKVLTSSLKVTAPVLQPHSWGAKNPSPTPCTANRQEREGAGLLCK